MKRNNYILVLIFLLGMGILLYPFVSNYVAQRNVVRDAAMYDKTLSKLSSEELSKAWKDAVSYNENLKGDPLHDPFVPDSGIALPENYESVLNMDNNGIMGYVQIPNIKVHLPIFHGTSDEVLAKGVGHIRETALPTGGKGNHTVLTGHTAYTKAEMFNRLIELKEGDQFLLYILDRKMTYEVRNIAVTLPNEINQLRAIGGKDYATLVTCTPYGVNTHRLLVTGVRVPNKNNKRQALNQVRFPWNIALLTASCFFALFLVHHGAKRRHKKEE